MTSTDDEMVGACHRTASNKQRILGDSVNDGQSSSATGHRYFVRHQHAASNNFYQLESPLVTGLLDGNNDILNQQQRINLQHQASHFQAHANSGYLNFGKSIFDFEWMAP